jgi:hypothetical protein
MPDPKKQPHEEAAARIKKAVMLRYQTEDAMMVLIDEVAKEYEPRVTDLEIKLADLLKKLGEGGEKANGKGGK